MENPPTIGIIGTGYVGLVTGVCFGELGYKILCSDVVQEKVDKINQGIAPIYEEGLTELLHDLLQRNLLRATTNNPEIVRLSDIIFICTGTPSFDDGSIDLQYIKSASKSIGQTLREVSEFKTIVVKSTVVPGTTDNFVKSILEEYSGKTAGVDFGLAMNPEFLKEGIAIRDFKKPDRIILGANDASSFDAISSVYSTFDVPKLRVDTTTAEMIKYASNTFLAVKISFINEIANLSGLTGANISKVVEGMGLDTRISEKFLRPGLGFGGSCFPKDLRALSALSKKMGLTSKMINAALEVNEEQPLRAIETLEKDLDLNDKKIALLGIAFKPGTDDVRESRAIKIAEELLSRGANVTAFDPIANSNANEFLPEKVKVADNLEDALKEADSAILVTEWDEFKVLKPKDFKMMKGKIIIDGRRIYDADEFLQSGFTLKVLGSQTFG